MTLLYLTNDYLVILEKTDIGIYPKEGKVVICTNEESSITIIDEDKHLYKGNEDIDAFELLCDEKIHFPKAYILSLDLINHIEDYE